MKKKEIPLYKLVVDPNSKELTLSGIDPVYNGAIEREWTFLNKSLTQPAQFVTNKFQYLTTACVLVPDKIIYRRDEETGQEYYVTIDKENIKNALKSLQRNNNHHSIQFNHEGELIDNIFLHEIWICENPELDKSKFLNLRNVVAGTLLATHDWSANINAFTNYVVSGKLNGYSIRGFFEHHLVKQVLVPVLESLKKEKAELIQTLNELDVNLQKLNK